MAVTDTASGRLEESDLLDIVMRFREEAETNTTGLRDRMQKAHSFKVGAQWDDAVKQANEARGKFCLTIPLIRPIIRQVCGQQIANPKDFKVYAGPRWAEAEANLLTALLKQALDNQQAVFVKQHWFERGLSSGVGFLGLFADKSLDPEKGNLGVKLLNEFEVMYDPACVTYDINDRDDGAKYLIWEPWVDKDKLEVEYPDKAEEMAGGGATANAMEGRFTRFVNWLVGTLHQQVEDVGDYQDRTKFRYQVTHTWWKEWKTGYWMYDPEKHKSAIDAPIFIQGCADPEQPDKKVTAKRIAAVKKTEGAEVIERPVPIMHHTIRVGGIFLEDIIDEFNLSQANQCLFPVVPFFCFYDAGYVAGMVEDLIGTQEQINWTESQELNVIKRLANTGYFVGSDTAGDGVRWLEQHGGEDGIIINKFRFGGVVEKIEPSALPTGYDRLTDKGIEQMRLISGVRTEIPEKDSVVQSGRAIALKQEATATGYATIFANFDYSMHIAGATALAIIRNAGLFTREEIREIIEVEKLLTEDMIQEAAQIVSQYVGDLLGGLPEMPEDPPMDVLLRADPDTRRNVLQQWTDEQAYYGQYQQMLMAQATETAAEMLMDKVSQARRSAYRLKVTTSSAAVTHRLQQFAEMLEMQELFLKSGQLPMSKKLLIESSDLANKDEVLKDDEEQQQAMMKAAQMAQQEAAAQPPQKPKKAAAA